MRILLLLNARFPTEKAYGIQTLTMAEGYVAAGHQVAIAFPRRTDELPQPVRGVVFLPFGPKVTLRWPWMFHPLRWLGAWQASSALQKFHPDVVIANDPVQAAMLSPRWPVVWELHDVPTLGRFGRAWLIRRIAKNARAIVSTNQLKIEKIRRVVPALPPHAILPNAVTFAPDAYRKVAHGEARRRLGLPESEFVIVYAGQLFDWKGVDTLIAAAADVPSKAVIHIVGGTGADLERCKGIAAALPKTAAHVVFHGLRPKEEIPTWLRAADLLAIPNSGRFEISVNDTSPLKLFEGLAAGAAIVASDLPSIREAVGVSSAVTFVRPDDPEMLSRAIQQLMNDPGQIEAMRQAAESFEGLLPPRLRAERFVAFLASLPAPRSRIAV